MKTILIPTDFSKNAEFAYPVAASIAKKMGYSITLFHVLNTHLQEIYALEYSFINTNSLDKAEELDAQDNETAKKKLNDLSKSPYFKGLEVKTELSVIWDKKTAEEITEFLNKKEHALIVMGSEGDLKGEETVAEVVTRHAVIPCITVTSPTQFDPKKIVLATDLTTMTRNFGKWIDLLSDKYSAEVDVLFINTPKNFMANDEIEKRFLEFCKKFNLPKCKLHIYNAYKVAQGIIQYTEKHHCDLIAVTTHGRTGLSHFFSGSLAEDLVVHSEIPVFVYNMHEYIANHTYYTNYSTPSTGAFS